VITKRLIYFDRSATHACDGKCNKAWGIGRRPKIQLSEDPDDFAYLADDELGDAPETSGIYEGGDDKPVDAKGPDDINRWCVRQCERGWLSEPFQSSAPPKPRDFSTRFYNIAPHRRDP
jgi:hypothetical protein